MILHGIEYQRPTSLNMRILADHVTYSFLAFMKSIFHFCLGCYCGGYSQNGRSNLSSYPCFYAKIVSVVLTPGMRIFRFIATTKQLFECSINGPVCLSVTPFSECASHCIIKKFWGVFTIDKGDVHVKGEGQRSKVRARGPKRMANMS